MKVKVKTLPDLVNDLFKVYNGLRNGDIPIESANASANVSSKIIKGASLQLKYNEFLEKREKIECFESELVGDIAEPQLENQ